MSDVVAEAFGEELQKIAEYVSHRVDDAPPAVQGLFAAGKARGDDQKDKRPKKEAKPAPADADDRGKKGKGTQFGADMAGWNEGIQIRNQG